MNKRQEDIHWRTGGKITHAGVECLEGGKDTIFIIDRIEFKDEEIVNGKKEYGVWLMHFQSNPHTKLPVILNATNKKRLVKLFPECDGFIARIKGKPVRMTKELTRDPQGGGQIYGLRVSQIAVRPEQIQPQSPQQGHPAPAAPAQPQAKQELLMTDDAMVSQAVAYLKGGGSIDAIRAKYSMSQETEKALLDKVKEA